jgi:hypothetical protein
MDFAHERNAGVNKFAKCMPTALTVLVLASGLPWRTRTAPQTSERPQGWAAPNPPPVGVKKTWGGPAFS